MWLLRRNGPLISGVCLNRDSGNDAYCPIFHVHNLANPFTAVTLTLGKPLSLRNDVPETILAKFHEGRYLEAARQMREQAFLPFSGPVYLETVICAYRDYLKRPLERYPLLLYEDIVTILLWSGLETRATQALNEFVSRVKAWPDLPNIEPEGGVEGWERRFRDLIVHPEKVRACVESEIVTHKLQNLPVSDWII